MCVAGSRSMRSPCDMVRSPAGAIEEPIETNSGPERNAPVEFTLLSIEKFVGTVRDRRKYDGVQ
jgi:hypothetical protein